jgi:hypothetical protein
MARSKKIQVRIVRKNAAAKAIFIVENRGPQEHATERVSIAV